MLDVKFVGSRIKELRLKRGMTQTAFAEALHVSFQAVSNWERGIAPPELENLINIASFFGVLTDDLLRPRTETLYLGVDGGGTKTEFVVTEENGRVLARFLAEGSNPNDIGFNSAANVISGGIREAIVKFPNISFVFCGIAGVSVGDNRQRMIGFLKEKYPALKIDVKTDSANLFGMDDEADLAVISGTGSVVFVRTGDRYERLGGWGYLFDTAGSAYDIGRDAVRVALADEDKTGDSSIITELLRKKLNAPSVFDAINKLYGGGKPYIASLSPIVFEAYSKNDAAAIAIIEKNAARIGELLNYGVKLYGARKKAVAGGGIFEHNYDIFVPILKKYTDVDVNVLGLPQIYGACRASVMLSGNRIPDSFEENFNNTYGGLSV